MTNVNTYSIGTNVGFFGDLLTGGISVNYSYSYLNTSSVSNAHGIVRPEDNGKTFNSSISVKDWSANSIIADNCYTLEWNCNSLPLAASVYLIFNTFSISSYIA